MKNKNFIVTFDEE